MKNIKKHYSKTVKTAKGHMNHIHENTRSTKEKPATFRTVDTAKLRGKMVHTYVRTHSPLALHSIILAYDRSLSQRYNGKLFDTPAS